MNWNYALLHAVVYGLIWWFATWTASRNFSKKIISLNNNQLKIANKMNEICSDVNEVVMEYNRTITRLNAFIDIMKREHEKPDDKELK